MSVTEEQLAELERLEREATPGPWRVDACEVLGPIEEAHEDVIVLGDADATAEDLAFIAAARNAVGPLIAEVRRLREENAMRDQRDEARELVRRYVEGDCLYEVQRLLSGVSLPAGELAAMRDQRDEEAKR